MSGKQIIISNFSRLLKSMAPSVYLLGELRSVQFLHESKWIASIESQGTDDDKNNVLLNALLEAPDDIEEQVMNSFISALRCSGQDHVANIFHRENDKVIMSDEHYELLRTNHASLCNFLNARDGLINSRTSPEIFSDADKRKILSKTGLNDMAAEMIDVLMRKSDDAFDKFNVLLWETGQSHVAYILTGDGNSGVSEPLKEEHRRRLLSSPREFLVQMIDSKHTGFITALMDKGVFSSYDEQRVTSVQPDTIDNRNEMILNLIARKSQADFFNFISALNDTDQLHVVVALVGAKVVAKIKAVYESGTEGARIAGVDQELVKYMREMFQRNGDIMRRLNDILSQNGVAVSAVEEGCIEVTFTCDHVESLNYLRKIYDFRELEKMINEAFCSQFAQEGLKSLTVEISRDQFTRSIPMTSEHRKALLSSAELLVDKVAVNDDLLDKLSLCKQRTEAVKSASTRVQQVKTLIDIVSRQPDSAFTQLINALNDTQQTEAVGIISGRNNRMWEEERHITENLQQIGKETTEREKQEIHAVSLEKAKQVADLRAEFDVLRNENVQLKREMEALSEGKDGKLKASLQRIQIFSENQEDEMKKKEEDNVNLIRRNKCLEDEISADRQVHVGLSVETHVRQLDELHSQTEETTELKETVIDLQRQQQQPTEEKHLHLQGKFYTGPSTEGVETNLQVGPGGKSSPTELVRSTHEHSVVKI